MIYLYMRKNKFNKNTFFTMTYYNQRIIFLIKYTPQRTLPSRWHLVQANLTSKSKYNLNVKEQDLYYWMFLAKHPDDQGKSN